MTSRGRSTAFVALALLLALAGGVLEQVLIHTDDGCPVEIHCVACRLAANTTSIAAAHALAISADVRKAGFVPPAAEQPGATPVSRTSASRGPPLT
jgi:hypothetical protein